MAKKEMEKGKDSIGPVSHASKAWIVTDDDPFQFERVVVLKGKETTDIKTEMPGWCACAYRCNCFCGCGCGCY